MLIKTPSPKVKANPCITEVENLEPNQNKTIAVMIVETLPSLIDGHALLKPIDIEFNKFLPESNSSLILSANNIFASTAKPIDKIKAAAPDKVNVTGIILNMAKTKPTYIIKVKDETTPGTL